MKKFQMIIGLVFILSIPGRTQEIVNLYPGTIPNSKSADLMEINTSGMYRGVTTPTLEVYLPEKGKATGAAVVICPGGGYSVIVFQGEGVSAAKEFSKNGVAAFVLKYRLPDDIIMPDKKIGPLQDAQQAIKLVRENAEKWGVDVHKVGIMGFSAGGHLASTEATHFKKAFIENAKNTSLRPDFQILVYPVITMQDNLTHRDSRNKLLGNNPSKETIDEFSNELQVDETTPPAYITHAADDNVVDVDNSINYFEKLRHYKVPVEMHIYPKGGHGFIFGHKGWMEPLFKWMENSKWISKL
ncbi:MAG: alpha/beta hydrolase [Bacteroidota bacterium]|nr:alpha/beta hydrolase [Bacteroidota bacterium]